MPGYKLLLVRLGVDSQTPLRAEWGRGNLFREALRISFVRASAFPATKSGSVFIPPASTLALRARAGSRPPRSCLPAPFRCQGRRTCPFFIDWRCGTDARWCQAGPKHDHCDICASHFTPSVEHVFWQCPFFNEIRCQQPPRSALARRLGWFFPTHERDAHVVGRLLMLGNIRCVEVKQRRHRFTWNVRGAEAAAWAAKEAD